MGRSRTPVDVDKVVARIDWTALSPEAADTIRTVALPIWLGFAHAEIAAWLGVDVGVVTERMRRLRAEIRAQVEPS